MAQAPPLTPAIRRRGRPGARERGRAGRAPPVPLACPSKRRTPDYINGHGQPGTSSDRYRWMRPDPGRPAGAGEALAATTDLMTGRVVTPITALPTATSSNEPPSDPSQHASHAHATPFNEEAAHDTSRAVPVSQWFRERWQTGPDGGRRWQNTRSTLAGVCAGHSLLLLVRGGAPGRNRTCDTRFRKPMLYPLSYEG
jgi:hypothetical protein